MGKGRGEQGSCYSNFLWIVNVVVMLLGGAFVSFALIALFVPEYNVGAASLLPKSALWLAVVFGSCLWVLAAVGIWGASTHNESKCLITTYMLVVLLVLVIQLSAGVTVFQRYGEFKAGNSLIERTFVTEVAQHPNDWVKTENTLECCGWYTNDHDYGTLEPALVTTQKANNVELCKDHGPETDASPDGAVKAASFCASLDDTDAVENADDPARVACRASVMAKVEKYSMTLGITGFVMVVVEFLCLVASCCLACCVPKEQGGYSEFFTEIRTHPVSYYHDNYGQNRASGPRY